ncbi:ATP-binding protein [Winogradskya consettensis]|uniref:Nuclease SbcCD subunit C n=1 Tax=Winogradskya consettensis TaxID=113560 RepID=A0A919SRB3_9ACTN|nr:AAA family ATPase [Actinoplanes consettensis]GIM77107.1 hypothetical protein Aco04nite_53770 [Actinoplanes consettensis]
MSDTMTLYQELADRLRTANVAESVTTLVLAAFQGDNTLAAVLRGELLPTLPAAAAATDDGPQVFLESVEATGFRGIGPRTALRLQPGPGLTVVAGRNGSAKSSLAESIEYALTEDSPRWAQRPATFRDGWRNLHHVGDREIAVRLRLGTGQSVTVRRSWAAGVTDLAAATVSVAQSGVTLPTGNLPAWAGPEDRHRPFLSARDLERVVTAKPAELYDAIAPILGLAPLTAADARLQARRKEHDDRVTALKAAFNELHSRLGTLDDPRAEEATRLLGRQAGRAKLPELAELAGGADAGVDAEAASAARRLAEHGLPDLGGTVDELAEAEAALRKLAGTEAAIAYRMADLLWGALEVHRDLGDQACPVCQVGVLDTGWREGAEEELARLRTATEAVRTAKGRHETQLKRAEGQLEDVRKIIEPALGALSAQLPQQCAAVEVALASLTLDEASWDAFVTAHAGLHAAAAEWLARRHDAWQEPGAALRRWVEDATVVQARADELALLTTARRELGTVMDRMRADRFRVAAEQSEHIWQLLRQESNVGVGEIKLGGTNTRRRVEIPVSVDGSDETSALAVMSQGELHAFGLALFLPRACSEASPYRFVVIDDPVQSMDPSKVDGLAEVLREVALTRQVVVFTHDDRLPEAIRRLGVEADIREVTRREGSIVEVRKNLWPARRYLEDARAVAVAGDIPDHSKRLMVAGFCRSAMEATAMDRYRAEQYAAGTPQHEIDAALNAAHSVQDRLTLGVFGDPGRRGQLYGYLNRLGVPRAVDTVQAVAKAVHGQCDMATADMVASTEALVRRLR